ncbi:TAXI family TRAP transporter solute-binding subunit [Saccharopolyspora erythraea]|uniref:TAXI family TRAP transporter solute-binding subunit n=1 Tax=Saccharopolyspora erythraea TaxID=1836 RepID=UPI001BA91D99|nr:TAXI family TRAP transporter solute-binding subunit [Saccharopolyspora erythraea]QUH02535.1 TAXI family TRAP transporter solute-binding subunit [Saccharopolyspora erythraea]
MSGIDRRRLLRLGAAGILAGVLPACAPAGPELPLRIAAGERGGFYSEFAALLAEEIALADSRLRPTVFDTEGSVANVELLRDGRAELALLLADVAQAAPRGELGPPVQVRALGRLYENYVQLVVPVDSPIRGLPDLRGRTVSLGAPKSGSTFFGTRLLARAGVEARTLALPLEEAVAALENGRIEALLWSGGVPTPALRALDERSGIRLVPLQASVPGLCGYAVCEQVWVPPRAYRMGAGVPTVGMANLLVCPPGLPDDVAATVVRVLVGQASRLVPRQAVGTQFLDVRTLTGTGAVPLHPGAQRAYRELHG